MIEIVTLKEVKLKIGETCKALRKQQKMSRDELAQALDISRSTIQNIENGQNATLDTILKIANHFDLLQLISKSLDDFNSSNNNNISLY